MSFVRSRQRVADHGEVFTPPALVDSMIRLVHSEAERVESRFLETACGSGNFLVPVLHRKLATVEARYGKSDFERRHRALLALMSIYGIELLADNVAECRKNLLKMFAARAGADEPHWGRAAQAVVAINIVHGDALSMQTKGARTRPISFTEWTYLGKGRYHRRDFRFRTLTRMSSFGDDNTLMTDRGKHEIFTPIRDHGQVSVADIARCAVDD